MPKVIIFTDLDATLLDEANYSHQKEMPVLRVRTKPRCECSGARLGMT